MHINVPDYVEHEAAYVAAAEARIKANAVMGKRKRFLADPDNAEVIRRMKEALYEKVTCGKGGNYCYEFDCGHGDGCGKQWDKPRKYAPKFLWEMERAYDDWGSLTPGQVAAVKRTLDQKAERDAEREAEHIRQSAHCQHVGEIGERREFVLSIDRSTYIRTDTYGYGSSHQEIYSNVMHDANGNIFVYFGKKLGEKGQAVRGKATIKKHDEYRGVKQTVLARPAFKVEGEDQ